MKCIVKWPDLSPTEHDFHLLKKKVIAERPAFEGDCMQILNILSKIILSLYNKRKKEKEEGWCLSTEKGMGKG